MDSPCQESISTKPLPGGNIYQPAPFLPDWGEQGEAHPCGCEKLEVDVAK